MSIIKESVTLTNEFRMNVCKIKASKDNSTQLIKGKKKKGLQTSSGSKQSKVCPHCCLINLIIANYLFQIACCQFEKSIIKINSTTDHYTEL